MEEGILFLAGLMAGIFYDLLVVLLNKSFPNVSLYHMKIKKVRMHHSIWGLVLIALYFIDRYSILLGAGVGIIIMHSLRNKSFLFIEYKGKRFF